MLGLGQGAAALLIGEAKLANIDVAAWLLIAGGWSPMINGR